MSWRLEMGSHGRNALMEVSTVNLQRGQFWIFNRVGFYGKGIATYPAESAILLYSNWTLHLFHLISWPAISRYHYILYTGCTSMWPTVVFFRPRPCPQWPLHHSTHRATGQRDGGFAHWHLEPRPLELCEIARYCKRGVRRTDNSDL